MKRIVQALVTSVLLLGVLTSAAFAKTKLTFWHTMNSEETKTLTPLLEEFRKNNPDVDLVVQYVSFGDAQNKYKVAALAGDAPDVFRSEIAWTAEFADMGILNPLEKQTQDGSLNDFLPVAMRYFQYKGKTWGVPQVTDCLALFYNKELFKKAKLTPPQTMDEFVQVAQQLTSKDGKQYGFALIPQGYFFQPFLWAYGGQMIDGDTRQVKLVSPESEMAFQAFADLVKKHKVTDPNVDFVNGYTNAITGFKDGKYAMMINGPWATSDVLTGKAFKSADNLGVALIPKGPKGDQGSPVGGHGYVIYRGSKNPDLAWKLISAINNTQSQVRFAKERNLLPTRKTAYDAPELKSQHILQSFWQQLQVARNRPVIPEGGLIYKDLDINVQAVLKGDKSPKEAVATTADAWNKLLKNKR